MSDDEPSGTTQQVVSNDPWSGVQPHITSGLNAAKDIIFNNPIERYPNSSVVPFSGQTENALGMMENRALSGNAGNQAAIGNITDTLNGQYMNADSNPYLNNAMDAATRPMVENFQDTIMPGIQSGFSGGGRYGSGLQSYHQREAGEDLTRQVGDVTSAMAYKNYGDERTNQFRASTMAPVLAQTEYDDIGALQNVGAIREQQAGGELQDDINRFYHEQTAPRDALREYMTLVNGGSYGGQSTSTAPIYSNDFATGLGYAGAAAGIAGGLFGGGSDSTFNSIRSLF